MKPRTATEPKPRKRLLARRHRWTTKGMPLNRESCSACGMIRTSLSRAIFHQPSEHRYENGRVIVTVTRRAGPPPCGEAANQDAWMLHAGGRRMA